jgi:hypothetical protein
VSGEIAQDAVCKLWIIPEGRMSEQKTEEKPQKRDEAADAMAKAAALKATLLATRLHGATAAP